MFVPVKIVRLADFTVLGLYSFSDAAADRGFPTR